MQFKEDDSSWIEPKYEEQELDNEANDVKVYQITSQIRKSL